MAGASCRDVRGNFQSCHSDPPSNSDPPRPQHRSPSKDTPNHSHSSRDPNSPEDGHSRSTHSGHSSHGHSPDARHGEDSDLDVAVIGRGDSGGSGKDGTHGGGGGGATAAADVKRTHTVQAAPPPAGKPAASPHRCAGSSPRRVPTATWGPAAPPASGDTRPAQTGVPRGSANRRLAPSSSSREERHVSLGKLKPTGEVDPSGDGNEDDSEDSRDSGEEAGTGRWVGGQVSRGGKCRREHPHWVGTSAKIFSIKAWDRVGSDAEDDGWCAGRLVDSVGIAPSLQAVASGEVLLHSHDT